MPAWLPAILLLVVSFVGLAWLDMRPHDGPGPLAAAFPPWWSATEIYRAAATAEVAVVRMGGWSALLIVQAADPGAPGRLRAAGAWAVLDGRAFGGCAAGG